MNEVWIASIKPGWRYAVGLEHRPELPAIPYYRLSSAEAFARESREQLPGRVTVVYKRVGWRTLCSASG